LVRWQVSPTKKSAKSWIQTWELASTKNWV